MIQVGERLKTGKKWVLRIEVKDAAPRRLRFFDGSRNVLDINAVQERLIVTA